MLKDAWEGDPLTQDIRIVWGNVVHDIQGQYDVHGNPIPYLHVQALHSGGRQVSLGGSRGSKHEKTGSLIAALRVPEGQGTVDGHDMLSIAGDAFQGKKSPNGVWFRNVTYVDVGTDRAWYLITMTATFIYDLIR